MAVIQSREVATLQGFLKYNPELECSLGQSERPL